MMNRFPSLVMGGLALGAGAVSAHHSAARFDFSSNVEVAGTVVEFEARNPHTELVLEVSDEKGTREIEFECHSRNNIYRRGWRPGMVETGDEITITIAPRRDGGDGGYVTSFQLADGTDF